MQKIRLRCSGWRTYAACAVLVLTGIASALGYPVPDWVVTIIAGLGGLAGRAAITGNGKKVAEDTCALVQSLSRGPASNHSAAD